MVKAAAVRPAVTFTITVDEEEMKALVRAMGAMPVGGVNTNLYNELSATWDGEVYGDGEQDEPAYSVAIDDYWTKIARIDIVVPTVSNYRVNVFQVKNHIRKYIEQEFGIIKEDVRTSIEPVA